jgi:hypothetical protein
VLVPLDVPSPRMGLDVYVQLLHATQRRLLVEVSFL